MRCFKPLAWRWIKFKIIIWNSDFLFLFIYSESLGRAFSFTVTKLPSSHFSLNRCIRLSMPIYVGCAFHTGSSYRGHATHGVEGSPSTHIGQQICLLSSPHLSSPLLTSPLSSPFPVKNNHKDTCWRNWSNATCSGINHCVFILHLPCIVVNGTAVALPAP